MTYAGDEDPSFTVKLKPHTRKCPSCLGDGTDPASGTYAKCPQCDGKGRLVNGYSVYLTRETVARALGLVKENGNPDTVSIPGDLRARRTVLQPGEGQILIRLKVKE